MPGRLYQVGAKAMCPHGGTITAVPSGPRVRLGQQPATTVADTFTITGCTFVLPNGKPQPCVQVKWIAGALRIKVNGKPAVLSDSQGLCLSAEQIPQGPPKVIMTQVRVKGM